MDSAAWHKFLKKKFILVRALALFYAVVCNNYVLTINIMAAHNNIFSNFLLAILIFKKWSAQWLKVWNPFIHALDAQQNIEHKRHRKYNWRWIRICCEMFNLIGLFTPNKKNLTQQKKEEQNLKIVHKVKTSSFVFEILIYFLS